MSPGTKNATGMPTRAIEVALLMFRKYRDLFIEIGLSRCRSVETVENLARAIDSLAANHRTG